MKIDKNTLCQLQGLDPEEESVKNKSAEELLQKQIRIRVVKQPSLPPPFANETHVAPRRRTGQRRQAYTASVIRRFATTWDGRQILWASAAQSRAAILSLCK